jgi:SAM-dependent methyltransferase
MMTVVDRLEYYRRRYAELSPGWEPATARYQRWVAQRRGPRSHVLDLGCGRGGIVERLGHVGHWVGVDPDRASLQAHRRPALPRGQATAERLPFRDMAFDLAVCSWVIEHAARPDDLFAEVTRILKPDGRFILLTPNVRHPIPRVSRWLARLRRFQKHAVPYFYSRDADNTFPVYYLANTLTQLDTLAGRVGLQRVRAARVSDPSYFAWNSPTFWLAVRLEALLPAAWKVHLIVEYRRSCG